MKPTQVNQPLTLAGICARYSTDNQDADSIEVQVQRCQKYCNEHGMTVVDVYADFAISGMKDTRPQYERMMADVRRGRINTVVIYDQSRMFRKMSAWFAFREELSAIGASVVSVTQPLVGGDLSDPANFVSEATMAIFNEVWVLQTRQKVKAKLEYMARNGQFTGGKPPLGYTVQESGGIKKLVIQEEEAKTVRRIFAEYLDGKSYREISEGLNRDGITTRNGGVFGTNSLHDLLRNKRYIGTITFGGMSYNAQGERSRRTVAENAIVMEDAIPAIIDKETFIKVQALMEQKKHHHPGRTSTVRDYPLRGKVFCGECGSALNVQTALATYHYYECSAKRRTHQCTLKKIRCDRLEQVVAGYIKGLFGNADIKEKAMAMLWESAEKVQNTSAGRMIALKDQHWEITAQINRIVDAIAKGVASDALLAKLADLEKQKNIVLDKMDELKTAVDAAQIPQGEMERIFEKIISASSTDLSAILSVVSMVEVYNDCIKVFTFFDDNPKKHKLSTEIFDSDGTEVLCFNTGNLWCANNSDKILAVSVHQMGVMAILSR